ncbi:MAG: hypothetical protein ACRETU_02575 [Steroidobacterales bacterium]
MRGFICDAALSLAILISGVGSAGAAQAPPAIFDLSLSSEAQALRYIEVNGHKSAAGPARIAIVNFTVEFVDSREAAPTRTDKPKKEAQAGDEPVPHVTASVAIALDRAQLQPLVDTLCDSLAENLRDSGTEVLAPADFDALASHAALASALASAATRRETTDASGKRTSMVLSAHERPALTDWNADATQAAERAAARSDGLTLLDAHFVVDFLTLRDTDERMFHRKMSPSYVQTIRAGESRLRLVRPDGSVLVATLKLPVQAPESPIGRSRTGGYAIDQDADEDSGNDIERLMVNPAVYYDQCLRYLGATEDMMLAATGFH